MQLLPTTNTEDGLALKNHPARVRSFAASLRRDILRAIQLLTFLFVMSGTEFSLCDIETEA